MFFLPILVRQVDRPNGIFFTNFSQTGPNGMFFLTNFSQTGPNVMFFFINFSQTGPNGMFFYQF